MRPPTSGSDPEQLNKGRRDEQEVRAEEELRFVRGRLLYRRLSDGLERGREDFSLTANRDGTRTLRSLARTDDSRFLRDVLYTLGADLSPIEVMVRLMVGPRFVGSGYFTRQGDELHLVATTAESGRVEQRLRVPLPFHMMTHAVMLDGWSFWGHEDIQAPIETPVYITSKEWNGTDGPVGGMERLRIAPLGEREVEVPVGRFECRGYSVTAPAIDSPPSEIWISGPDALLVRYQWPGFDLDYVLAELDRGTVGS